MWCVCSTSREIGSIEGPIIEEEGLNRESRRGRRGGRIS